MTGLFGRRLVIMCQELDPSYPSATLDHEEAAEGVASDGAGAKGLRLLILQRQKRFVGWAKAQHSAPKTRATAPLLTLRSFNELRGSRNFADEGRMRPGRDQVSSHNPNTNRTVACDWSRSSGC